MSSKVFKRTGSLMPGRSVFDLSYDKKMTADMGYLYPIMCDEVVPGDKFEIGNEIVIRFQPLVAPVLHEINAYVHYFFVPYRLLDDTWEDFITGGPEGDSVAVLPRWDPTSYGIGSLWDYLGFPAAVKPTGRLPLDFPRRAYNLIYNEYYRDENLIDEVALTNESILKRAWEKDYFTSALPWQQRGTAPALPISGSGNADFSSMAAAYLDTFFGTDTGHPAQAATTSSQVNLRSSDGTSITSLTNLRADVAQRKAVLTAGNTIDFGDAITFNVSDLRLAFQIQKWLERNARAGVRYTEFLGAHFGVHPRDERLQRPEYLGGSKNPVIISEVLQTSSTDTESPQGNLAGHGISVGQTFCASYFAEEFGLIMGIMSVMPKPAYQQGLDRQWLRQTRYDFYFPEFANLSEQAIERVELYASAVETENKTIFGYQGRYDEMRVKRNQVCALMRTDFNYWHMGRIFASAPGLNQTFVDCDATKRIFAAPSEPGLIIDIGNRIRAIRPMPIQSEPGLIDHN